MAKRAKSRTSGIDLEPIFGLLSQLGLGGSMSSPAGNPSTAMGRAANQAAGQQIVDTSRAVANEASNWTTPYSLDEWSRISRGQAQPSDAAWAALYALPMTRPLKRARNAFRTGRAALKGVKTPNTGSRQTAGMAQEPSGELEYAGLTALLRLLEK